MQDEIAAKVATALDVVLDEGRLQRMRSFGLRDPAAFVLYQKAQERYARAHEIQGPEMVDTLAAANELLEQALAITPDFSPAHMDHADYYIHDLLTYLLPGEGRATLSEPEIAEALALAQADYRRAMETAASESQRLNATLELAIVSGDFGRLPQLYAAAAESGECLAGGWWAVITSLLRSLDAPLAIWMRAQQCNPLDFFAWASGIRILVMQGEFQAAIDMGQSALDHVQHVQISEGLIMAHIGAGRYADAQAVNERLIEDPWLREFHRLMVASAQDPSQEVPDWLSRVLEPRGVSPHRQITALARAGERAKVNALVATLDAAPLGYLELLEAIQLCACGAPWDLQATPNLAGLLAQADFLWPPRSPIEWPLKDW